MTDTTAIREIAITRTIDAPAERVFQAWTQPEHFTHWFGAPQETITMDVRPGGSWKAILPYEGTEIPFHGVYSEVEKNKKLVFSLIDENDPELAAKAARGEDEESVFLTFTEKDGRTTMDFRQAGHLEEEQIVEAKAGWEGWFDALAAYVTKA